MCGIFGVVSFKDSFSDKDIDTFKFLTNLVSHRGPNSYGFYLNKERNIFLGHRRLSILDLREEGNQPMEYKDNIIVYNREIFNFLDLRKDIEREGINFISNTDTEIILKGIVKKGINFVKNFDGMWAFLIWDNKNKKLIISRDRYSLKPLFYLKKNNRIYFASEIKQLLPLLEIKNFNINKIFNFLKQGILDFDDETFFENIMRFPSGEIWIVDMLTEKIKRKKYWDFKPMENYSISYREVIDKFRSLLLNSIKKRLISDVPVSVLLSGGLDSSSISVLVKKYFNKEIETFSIIGNNPKYTEKKYIDYLSNEKKIKNTQILINEDIIKNHIDETLKAQDEPFGSMSIIAQFYLFKYIKNNSKAVVILSGQGGDELLGGYLKYFFFFLKESLKNKNIYLFFKNILFSIIYRTVLWQLDISLAKRYIPFLINNNKYNFLKLNGELEPIWKFQSFKDRQLKDILKYSIPILARYEDRNSMYHSLEVRHPFLDYKFVEFCINLPNVLKVKDGWLKYILRKSIYELPKNIRWRKDKQGFLIPQDIWIKTIFEEEINNTINKNSMVVQENIIDLGMFKKVYENLKKDRKTINSTDIFRVYILEKWLKTYF